MYQGNFLHEALQSELPEGLSTRVAGVLAVERAKRARVTHMVRMLSGALSLISFGGVFFAVQSFLAAATASGFTSYASLLVSDTSVVIAHLDLFFASLAESIPSVEGAVALALIAVFLVSLRNAVGFGMHTRTSHLRTA